MSDKSKVSARRQRSISDIVLAVIVIGGGIAVIVYASGMKLLNTGQMGPGLFPTVIGWLLVLFGVTLFFQGLRGKIPESEVEPEILLESEMDEPIIEGDNFSGGEYTLVTEKPGRLLINGLVVLLGIVFYIVVAPTLGFIPTLFIVLLMIMLTLREKAYKAAIYSALFTIGLYLVFEKVLLVQLPDGILGF